MSDATTLPQTTDHPVTIGPRPHDRYHRPAAPKWSIHQVRGQQGRLM